VVDKADFLSVIAIRPCPIWTNSRRVFTDDVSQLRYIPSRSAWRNAVKFDS